MGRLLVTSPGRLAEEGCDIWYGAATQPETGEGGPAGSHRKKQQLSKVGILEEELRLQHLKKFRRK